MTVLDQDWLKLFDSIAVDEIGLESGFAGGLRLITTYQPIYGLSPRGWLEPRALRGGYAVDRRGARPASADIAKQPAGQRARWDRLVALLALRNWVHAEAGNLPLYLDRGMSVDLQTVGLIEAAKYMRFEGLAPALPEVICEIDAAGLHANSLSSVLELVQGDGKRLALVHGSVNDQLSEWISALSPRIVRIDGGWFGTVCRHDASRRLLGSLIGALRQTGSSVLIDDIDTPELLQYAIEAGADQLQGRTLLGPALAGHFVDLTPLEASELLKRSSLNGADSALDTRHQSG